ncbi:Phosphatase 2C family protein, putative [Theobroma cacao]|uniref:Phosphatase 2C family protein, putative n=1 Tax=Theobroma cacao TaxID=3641 RepID=A0A061EML1_THECC|nr:Phosphatase 2C family protein, putative [Theobroma cacao]
MGLKDLRLKLKAFRLRRFRVGDGGSKKRENGIKKKPSWMMPISHGYHVVDHKSLRGSSDDSDFDSVVVQREQIEELELWFFGVFDARIGDGITKYIQSHFFDKKPKESQVHRKSKETMRRAYLGARAKVREAQKEDETLRAGSASVMLINGEKLVTANLGGYRAVICRDGVAHQLSSKRHSGARRHWTRRLFPVRMLVCDSTNAAAIRHGKSSELLVGAEKVDAETEFIIIASNGIWEVMKNQEAVNLIRHLGDPQEAAEWLTKEALSRMSKNSISCVVIRFD